MTKNKKVVKTASMPFNLYVLAEEPKSSYFIACQNIELLDGEHCLAEGDKVAIYELVEVKTVQSPKINLV